MIKPASRVLRIWTALGYGIRVACLRNHNDEYIGYITASDQRALTPAYVNFSESASGPWVTPSASILAQSVSSSRALDQDVASYYVGDSFSWLFGPYCAHSPALTPMSNLGQGGPITALRITEKTLAWSPKARGQYTRASYLSWSRWSRDTSMDRGSRRGGDAASGAKRVRRFCCGVHAHLGRATCADETDPLDPLQGDHSHTLPTSSSGIPLAEIYMLLGRNDQRDGFQQPNQGAEYRTNFMGWVREAVHAVRDACDTRHTNLLLIPPSEVIPEANPNDPNWAGLGRAYTQFEGYRSAVQDVAAENLVPPYASTVSAGGGLLLGFVNPPTLKAEYRTRPFTDSAHYMDPDTCNVLPNLIGCALSHLRKVRYGITPNELGPIELAEQCGQCTTQGCPQHVVSAPILDNAIADNRSLSGSSSNRSTPGIMDSGRSNIVCVGYWDEWSDCSCDDCDCEDGTQQRAYVNTQGHSSACPELESRPCGPTCATTQVDSSSITMTVGAMVACAIIMLALCLINRNSVAEDITATEVDSNLDTPTKTDAATEERTNTTHQTQQQHHYRADIDGLRTVAVVSVIIFHYFPHVLPGGFVGVDVFFVISGYLISGIISRQAGSGTFRYAQFYSKRVRRIFPALLVVLATVLLVGSILLSQDLFIETSATAAWACGFGANLRFEFYGTGGMYHAEGKQVALIEDQSTEPPERDYFTGVVGDTTEDDAGDLDRLWVIVNPLLHMWSLGVEEQFYIIWPIVVTSGIKLGSVHREGVLYACLICASFVTNLVIGYTSNTTSASYYLPFTRFWELAIGALLALVDQHRASITWLESLSELERKKHSEIVALSGAVLLILSVVLVDETWVFPGWIACLPTLGTGLVIGGPIMALEGESTRTNQVIGNKLFAFVGRISYPMYVWHWPLLIYGRLLFQVDPTTGQLAASVKIGLASLSILMSLATLYGVEEQLRAGAWPCVVIKH